MEIRKDFESLTPELSKALLMSNVLKTYDSNWSHDKNQEDMQSIYFYPRQQYIKMDMLYSHGRQMCISLRYSLESFNLVEEHSTIYSWVHHLQNDFIDYKDKYEEYLREAALAQEQTGRQFSSINQMMDTMKRQIKMLDDIKILITIIKAKDLYLMEEKAINKTLHTSIASNSILNSPNNVDYDVFISHATEDKESHVIPFCSRLDKENVTYWLDTKEIQWGDSIIRKINQGLKNSKYAIVILSSNFIKKKWTVTEMEAILNIETNSGEVRVLPLIIGDDNEIKNIINEYPLLNTKRYLKYSDGLDPIILALKQRLEINIL